MGSVLKSKDCWVGAYADNSTDSWLGFPGSGLNRHFCGVYRNYDSTSRSRAILKVKEVNGDRHIFLSMRAYLYARLNNTSDYPFAIYISHKAFELHQAENSVGIGGISKPSHVKLIHKGQMGRTGGSGRTLHTKKLSFSDIDLGNFDNYRNDKSNKKAYIYLAGVGYYNSSPVTSGINIDSTQLEIESVKDWYDYYPGAVYAGNEKWLSTNRSSGYTKVFTGNAWKPRKNSYNEPDRSTSFVNQHTDGSFSQNSSSIASEFGDYS